MSDKTYAERFGTPSRPDGCPVLIAAALTKVETENAALREALVNADEIERYSGSNGERQWGRCSAWLNPDDAVIIISAKALDAARNSADHSGDINEMMQVGKEAQP